MASCFRGGIWADGTSVLGGVSYILSREEIEKGVRRGETQVPPMYQELIRNGLSDQELIDGKVVIIIYQWYRHNRSRDHYVFDWAIVEKGIKVKEGNVVELRLSKPYAIVTGILYDDLRNSECKWILGDRGGFGALDLVNPGGGPGTSNLYCPTLEQAGWQKTPFGMYT